MASTTNLNGVTLKIVTRNHEPFIDVEIDKHTGRKMYSGFCIEILKELERILGFTYELIEVGEYDHETIGRVR